MAIEIEESTLLDDLLHYGLLIGAAFQLICIFAVMWLPKSEAEQDTSKDSQTVKPHLSHAAQHSQVTTSKRKREKKKNR